MASILSCSMLYSGGGMMYLQNGGKPKIKAGMLLRITHYNITII